MNLSSEEKSVIKQSLLNFIYQNPTRPIVSVRPNPLLLVFIRKLNFAPVMASLLLVSVLVSGGLAVGAEKALPGDILYPVKVGLNEEVRGWVSVSEKSRANWEIERVQRRLKEAETLAEVGLLDVESREKIEANFEAHADRVKKRIEKFENKEDFHAAVDVSSKFETSLKAHQTILNRLTAESKEEVKKEVRPIHFKVKSEAKAWAKTRKKMELRAKGDAKIESEGVDEEDDDEEIELELENDTN